MHETPITIADIEAAERLAGVAYSASERELMLGNIEDQLTATLARRRLRLPNAAPPASRFDPRLAGFTMPTPDGSLHFSTITVPPPAADEDIAFAPVTQLSAWIATRQ